VQPSHGDRFSTGNYIFCLNKGIQVGGFLAFIDSAVTAAVAQKTFVGQKQLFLFAVPARFGHKLLVSSAFGCRQWSVWVVLIMMMEILAAGYSRC
jgi:hypothetical protein